MRIVVAPNAFKGSLTALQAAEAIRNQLQKQTNVRDLVVVPKADIVNSLTSSGYSPTEALPAGDAKALAESLAAVLDDDQLRNDLVARGLARSGQFTWQRAAGSLWQLYADLVG